MATENSFLAGEAEVIRVFVAESTLMANELLAAALSSDSRFCVVGTGKTEDEVLAGLRSPIDVVLVGMGIGAPSWGAHLTRRLVTVNPRVRVAMLLERAGRDEVVEAFRSGAAGVLSRTEPIEVLWRCIESVHRGKVWANDDALKFLLEALANRPSDQATGLKPSCALNEREQVIVQLVAEGFTNREIAAELNLNEHTLKYRLEQLFEKLDVSSRTEMVLAASARDPREPYPVTPEEYMGASVDNETRYKWYSRAAEQPFPFAHLTLGEMHLEGIGTRKDAVGAYAWFSVAEESARRIMNAGRAYREWLASGLSDEQVARADQMAAQWLAQHPKEGGLLQPQFNDDRRDLPPPKPLLTRLKRVC